MQTPRTGVRWMVAAIASINITAFAPGHAASVAPGTAENGMGVSAHHFATMVGVDVLKGGGNAVDAAVAVGYALAVVYPAAGNLGGGGFMTIELADGRKTFLDFREMAPKPATANIYLYKDGNVIKGLSTQGPLHQGASRRRRARQRSRHDIPPQEQQLHDTRRPDHAGVATGRGRFCAR